MRGFARMNKDRRSAGCRESGRNLAADMAGFAHAGDDQLAAGAKDQLAGLDKVIIQHFVQQAKCFGFDPDNLAPTRQYLAWFEFGNDIDVIQGATLSTVSQQAE